jgi:phytoene synthase
MSDAVAELVRRHDPDRFLTALFAPADRRGALFTLYAFNHELARAREVASEPTLALIRLNWWREVLDGARKRHEVATPLADAVAQGLLVPADLHALIDAREAVIESPPETVSSWWTALRQGPGGLAVAAARLLEAPEPDAYRAFGAAYGAAGLLRAWPALASQRYCPFATDTLAEQGLTPEAMLDNPHGAPARAVLAGLARDALARLRAAPRPGHRPSRAAGLVGVLAARDLRRWPAIMHPRGLGDRLSVAWAGLTGRL